MAGKLIEAAELTLGNPNLKTTLANTSCIIMWTTSLVPVQEGKSNTIEASGRNLTMIGSAPSPLDASSKTLAKSKHFTTQLGQRSSTEPVRNLFIHAFQVSGWTRF
jgi:hypothetical protein